MAGRINGKVIYEAVDPTLSEIREEFLLADAVNALCYSADGKSIGAGTGDGAVWLLNVRSGKKEGYRLTVHSAITDLADNPLNILPYRIWHSDSFPGSEFASAEQSSDGDSGSTDPVTTVNESHKVALQLVWA